MDKFNQEISDFLISRNYRVENGRLHLSVLCDSTEWFRIQMVNFLKDIGCTEIQTKAYYKDNSEYGFCFEASGLMPKGMVIKEVKVR